MEIRVRGWSGLPTHFLSETLKILYSYNTCSHARHKKLRRKNIGNLDRVFVGRALCSCYKVIVSIRVHSASVIRSKNINISDRDLKILSGPVLS